MRACLPILCAFLLLLSCQTKTQEDARIAKLEKDVARLSEENKLLQREVAELRQGSQEAQTQEAIPAPQTSSATARPAMTVDRMKAEVEPLLEEVIRKIKASSETPRKGNQFGMRIEFDMKHAVYGLVQNKDRRAPYAARVLVTYEKFLESQRESRSYGTGTEEFLFVYRNRKWVYEKTQ